MVTTAGEPDIEVTYSPVERTLAEAKEIAANVEAQGRSIIAGHPEGAIRRIMLYLVAGAAALMGWPLISCACIFLLAVTDADA